MLSAWTSGGIFAEILLLTILSFTRLRRAAALDKSDEK